MYGSTYVGGTDQGWSVAGGGSAFAAPFGSSGLGTGSYASAPGGSTVVGGSWSPEPAANLPILQGALSSQGTPLQPQAAVASNLLGTVPASHAAHHHLTGTAPAATTGAQDRAARTEKPKSKTVKVKPGDTLSKIAAANGTTWQKLYQLNKGAISDPNVIRAGQSLKLP